MRIQLQRADFLSELALVQGIAERRPTIPVLSHLMLSSENGGLVIKATDLDVSLHAAVDAEVEGSGAVALKAAMLHQIVRALDSERVEIEMEGENEVQLKGGRSRFRLRGLPAADFPTLPEMPQDAGIEIPFALLKRMISRVLFAVASDETRYQLNGALLEQRDGALAFVATDGYRLALVENELEGVSEAEGVLVPRKALAELLRIDHDGTVTFRRGEHHLAFRLGGRELICRNLEGAFPDYERVIAKDHGASAIFSRTGLSDAVGRVGLLTGERARGIKLKLAADKATVTATNPDLGDAVEEVTCEYDGEEMEFGVNPDYVSQFLAATDAEKIELRVKDESSQAVGVPVEGEDRRYLCVIMPMRL